MRIEVEKRGGRYEYYFTMVYDHQSNERVKISRDAILDLAKYIIMNK